MLNPEFCPECRQPIPTRKNGPPKLACPLCLARKNYQYLLQFQKPFLERIRRGEMQLSFRKKADAPKFHIALLAFRNQAWCGGRIESGWKGKKNLAWTNLDETTPVCERCRAVLEGMLKEKTAEVA